MPGRFYGWQGGQATTLPNVETLIPLLSVNENIASVIIRKDTTGLS